MNKNSVCAFALCILGLSFQIVRGQTMGLMQHDSLSYDKGYVLFSPIQYTSTYLIDKCGYLAHEWTSTYQPGQSAYLLPDGNLLREGNTNNVHFNAGGKGGIIEKLDWSSNILWSYVISSDTDCAHHDFYPLPNGNILVIAWESKTDSEAIDMGRDPANVTGELWGEKIMELQPTGTSTANIIWEWHAWDHMVQHFDNTKANYAVVAAHPELININFPAMGPSASAKDWLHANSIAYIPEFDQIIISMHSISEFWIIDHSTTTEEAASHTGGTYGKGGDILYRWGNPLAYGHGAISDKLLFGQHAVYQIPDGLPYAKDILLFNNGLNRSAGNYSTVERLTLPTTVSGDFDPTLPYLPSASSYTYTAPTPTDFYSPLISNAQMLPNKNLLICEGLKGHFFEIDSNENMVWDYINPVGISGPMTQGDTVTQNACFRANFYENTYSGLTGHPLTSGVPVELDPIAYTCDLNLPSSILYEHKESPLHVSPNPCVDFLIIDDYKNQNVSITDILGKYQTFAERASTGKLYLDISQLPAGIFLLHLNNQVKKFVVAR